MTLFTRPNAERRIAQSTLLDGGGRGNGGREGGGMGEARRREGGRKGDSIASHRPIHKPRELPPLCTSLIALEGDRFPRDQ